jgi:hypothetical protein
MATYTIEIYDAPTQNWRAFTYTTAPEKMDLFDTRPEALVLIGTFDGRQVRLVSTSKADHLHQVDYYRSQGYLAVDGRQWADMYVNAPQFQRHPTYQPVRQGDVYPYACGDLQVDETLSRKGKAMARKQTKQVVSPAPVAQTETAQPMKRHAVQSGRRAGKTVTLTPADTTPAPAKAPVARKTHQAVSGKVVDAPEVRPIRTCSNCGKRFYGRDRDGRCGVCFDYRKKNGKDRVHTHPTPDIIVGAPTLGMGHVRPPKQTAPVAAVIVDVEQHAQETSTEDWLTQGQQAPAPAKSKRGRRAQLESEGQTLVVTEVKADDTLVVEPVEERKVELELISGGTMAVTVKGQEDLTTEQVQAIRRRFIAGETKAALGREFKRSPKTISDIVTYKSYKNVPKE